MADEVPIRGSLDPRARGARLALLAAWLAAGTAVGLAQGGGGAVTGRLSDPAGAALVGVVVVLSGVDVRDAYTTRTDGEGRYEFPRVVPGAYRVDVPQPGIVPVVETLTVRAGEVLRSDIRTALKAEIGLTLPAASVAALRRWASGGPPPVAPIEWGCRSKGKPCIAPTLAPVTGRGDAVPDAPAVMPLLIRQPLSEIMLNALTALGGGEGIVQLTGVIGADGFLGGLSINSATSPELAAAALAEAGRTRWEPGRLRGVPVNTLVSVQIQVN
jgi:hypothetical protein